MMNDIHICNSPVAYLDFLKNLKIIFNQKIHHWYKNHSSASE